MRNWRKIFLTVCVCLTLVGILGGCSKGQGPQTTTPQQPSAETQTAGTQGKTTQLEKEVILYRLPQDGTQFFVPEKAKIKTSKGQEPLDTLKALVSTKPGQDVKGLNSFPKDTKVLGLTVKDGVARADFSKELYKKGQGEYEVTMLFYSVVDMLTEFPEIKKVQFLKEGKPVEVLGQLDLSEPLERNKTFIKK